MIEVKRKFLSVYQEFFKNKDLLGEAGAFLSVLPEEILAEDGWGVRANEADNKLLSMFTQLVGGLDVTGDEYTKVVEKIAEGYKDQPYWRELLFDCVEYFLLKEEKEIIQREKELLNESKAVLNDILLIEAQEKKVVQSFAEKIKEAGFKVNAQMLVSNYLKMCQQNKEEAWSVLTTNPALFSPILVKDKNGKVILTPDQAREENARLAKFLKRLKL